MAKKTYVLHKDDEYIQWLTSDENGDKQPCGTLIKWKRQGVKNVAVPYGVKVIGKGCFQASIGDVVLPSSVTEIQDFAFDICNGKVHIPNTVTKIGKHAFGGLEERKRILQKAYEDGVMKKTDYDIVQSVIITTENSTAHQYAKANKIRFELVKKES
jgi:hypothetical protein